MNGHSQNTVATACLFVFTCMLVFSGADSFAQKDISPRDRFVAIEKDTSTITRIRKHKIEMTVKRSYVFDSVYSVDPGGAMFDIDQVIHADKKVYDFTMHQTYDVSFKSLRKRPYRIRIKVKHLMEFFDQAGKSAGDTTSETHNFKIKSPDVVTTLKIGSEDKPTFELQVTMDGKRLYYRVVGDWVPPR